MAATKINWIAVMAALFAFSQGTMTLPQFIAAMAAALGKQVPATVGASPSSHMKALLATSPIPANLQADLQAIVDAATSVTADTAAVSAAQSSIDSAQAMLATDKTTLATAQQTFTTDLTAYLASNP